VSTRNTILRSGPRPMPASVSPRDGAQDETLKQRWP
jgi:hypothetical protein